MDRNWTRYMANSGSFRHNPNYMAELIAYGQSNATLFSENIAYGYRRDVQRLHG